MSIACALLIGDDDDCFFLENGEKKPIKIWRYVDFPSRPQVGDYLTFPYFAFAKVYRIEWDYHQPKTWIVKLEPLPGLNFSPHKGTFDELLNALESDGWEIGEFCV